MNAPFSVSSALDGAKLRVLSLGAGVQSTTLALMAAHGEIGPMPDLAIFADTGAEPTPVYEHLRWLMSGNVLPFPVHVISAGNIRDEIIAASQGIARNDARPPFFVENADGSQGMIRRQCTQDYKIDPINKKVRELLGLKKGERGPKAPVVEQWIGISWDEIQRASTSRIGWIQNRHPLLELGMKRHDCLVWLNKKGYPVPPKSACTFCPFRKNTEWRWLRDNDPRGFAEAVSVDSALRNPDSKIALKGTLYVHRDLRPLSEVDIRSDEERGQSNFWGMQEECEGMCGL